MDSNFKYLLQLLERNWLIIDMLDIQLHEVLNEIFGLVGRQKHKFGFLNGFKAFALSISIVILKKALHLLNGFNPVLNRHCEVSQHKGDKGVFFDEFGENINQLLAILKELTMFSLFEVF